MYLRNIALGDNYLKKLSKHLAIMVLSHLFVKVSRPRDSEDTFSIFESSCHLLLPV